MSTTIHPFNRAQIEQRIRELGQWFHNLDLGGIQTAPDHFLGDYPQNKWDRLAPAIPADLRGATVLDIGCNGGFFSIQLKRRGAARVVGIDSDPDYLEQARFAAEVCGVDLDLRCMSVYDIGQLREKFDWVLFMGVLYHLRYPLLALDLIRDHVVRHRMIFQSMLRGAEHTDSLETDYPFSEEAVFNSSGYPKLHFVEGQYAGDPTNWWIPNRACVEAMLRSADFEIISRPEREIYVCRPGS